MGFRNPITDLIIALVVVLLIFGPKRLPTLGRSLGQGLREFKDSITGNSTDEDEDRPALNAAEATPAVVPSSPPPAASVSVPATGQAAPAPGAPERESAEVGSTEQRA